MHDTLAPRHLKASLMLFSTSLFWGLSFPVGKALEMAQAAGQPGAATWFLSSSMLMWRFAFAAFIVAIFSLRALARLTRNEVVQGSGIGLFAAIGMLLQMDALNYTHASVSAFLTQASCIFVPAYVALRFRRPPSFLIVFCCALVFAGIAILCHVSPRNLQIGRGEWETLLSSVFFSAQILFLQKAEYIGNRSSNVSLLMFATIAVLLLPVAIWSAQRPGELLTMWRVPMVGWLIIALTFICTLLTFTVMNHWQKYTTATEASLIYCFEPVFATMFALFLPGWLSAAGAIDYRNETFDFALVIGGSLILVANVILAWRSSTLVR